MTTPPKQPGRPSSLPKGSPKLLLQRPARCPACRAEYDQERAARREARGIDTPEWHRVRRQALAASGGVCALCGQEFTSGDPASAHLNPALGGNHRNATVADVRMLRRSCHGRVGAPRTDFRVATRSGLGVGGQTQTMRRDSYLSPLSAKKGCERDRIEGTRDRLACHRGRSSCRCLPPRGLWSGDSTSEWDQLGARIGRTAASGTHCLCTPLIRAD
jgi:hypothetical protein